MRKWMIVVTSLALFMCTIMAVHSTVDARSFGWGFKKNSDHELPEIGRYHEMLNKYGAYYADESGDKVVYLTFDNGYEEGYTDDILDVLKEENVPGAFFVTGHYVDSEPELVKRMVDEGHIVGNHSYHHPDLTTLTKGDMKKELEAVQDQVAAITDQKQITYMRPPKGAFNEQSLKWANDLGYTHIFWSLAFVDWNTDSQKGGDYAFDQVMEQIHPGAIILMHTVSSDNAEALSKLIRELKEQGYQFKSLDDMVVKDVLPEGLLGL